LSKIPSAEVALGKSKREVISLRQRRVPGIVNVFEVNDASQIKALANDPIVDRFFDTRTCPINWFLLKRSLLVLSFKAGVSQQWSRCFAKSAPARKMNCGAH
jgi:hypothetical protein